MADGDNEKQPIIKKIRKVEGGGHGGGVWKLAYADFVTAMMAFFLLMWLLNVTSEEMKSGLAQYFAPEALSPATSGSGDVFYGLTISVDQPREAQTVGVAMVVPIPEATRAGQGGPQAASPEAAEAQKGAGKSDVAGSGTPGDTAGRSDGGARSEARADAKEAERWAQVARELKQQLTTALQREGLGTIAESNLQVEGRSDGVILELVDSPRISMFEIGRSAPLPETRRFLEVIAGALRPRAERISVVGHTDGRQYPNAAAYSNWELAAERANAARRLLAGAGIAAERFSRVLSRADLELKVPGDPLAAENRRIQLVLER